MGGAKPCGGASGIPGPKNGGGLDMGWCGMPIGGRIHGLRRDCDPRLTLALSISTCPATSLELNCSRLRVPEAKPCRSSSSSDSAVQLKRKKRKL
jgi:hypothetical protein